MVYSYASVPGSPRRGYQFVYERLELIHHPIDFRPGLAAALASYWAGDWVTGGAGATGRRLRGLWARLRWLARLVGEWLGQSAR